MHHVDLLCTTSFPLKAQDALSFPRPSAHFHLNDFIISPCCAPASSLPNTNGHDATSPSLLISGVVSKGLTQTQSQAKPCPAHTLGRRHGHTHTKSHLLLGVIIEDIMKSSDHDDQKAPKELHNSWKEQDCCDWQAQCQSFVLPGWSRQMPEMGVSHVEGEGPRQRSGDTWVGINAAPAR